MHKALLIAAGHYLDPDLGEIPFAADDAQRLSQAWAQAGNEPAEHLLLIDNKATSSIVQLKLLKAIDSLQADDTFKLFYAGYGFSIAGQNFLACHDTLLSDLEETALALAPILQRLRTTPCRRVALFLDCAPIASLSVAGPPRRYDDIEEIAIERELSDHPHCVCFGARRLGEASSRSGTLGHGIWAHHLAEAWEGRAPAALSQGRLLAANLQRYVAEWVPRTLRLTYADGCQQTPWLLAGSGANDVELADLRDLLAAHAEASQTGGVAGDVALVLKSTGAVKSLPGFNKKFHRVPDNSNRTAESFVAKLAQAELEQDLDRVYDRLVNAFDFAYADLTSAGPEEGQASIITKSFKYSVSVTLNPDDPAEVCWVRKVDSITDADTIRSTPFLEVFRNAFDTIEFGLVPHFDLKAFVHTVQAARNPNIRVRCDRDLTYCDVQLTGFDATIRIERCRAAIVHRSKKSPEALLDSFRKVALAMAAERVALIP